MVIRMSNTVDHGIAHHDIGVSHINFQAQNMFTIFELPILHLAKEGKIFFRTTFTIRTVFSCLTKVTAIGVNIISTLAINISFTILNQNFCKLIEAIKVVAGVIKMVAPIKPQPFDCIQNTVCVFDIFFYWVSVIKAHIAARTTRLIVVVSSKAKV